MSIWHVAAFVLIHSPDSFAFVFESLVKWNTSYQPKVLIADSTPAIKLDLKNFLEQNIPKLIAVIA
ncbi:hypothetical protein BLOT_009837 [Blomia tropicalis]|nr:hypothetical protein BLOT_009837 [Blomia tropicalis]